MRSLCTYCEKNCNPKYIYQLEVVVCPVFEKRKQTKKYQAKEWKQKVFKRDNYCCQNCESETNLNAHHIFSVEKYPKKKYDVNNGITLCHSCHSRLHKIPQECESLDLTAFNI